MLACEMLGSSHSRPAAQALTLLGDVLWLFLHETGHMTAGRLRAAVVLSGLCHALRLLYAIRLNLTYRVCPTFSSGGPGLRAKPRRAR